MNGEIVVREILAAETHDLRRRVLRDGDAEADVEWAGDDDPLTAHLGAVVGGRLVAISTWLIAPDPMSPASDSVQLRGMATEPDSVGRGLGRIVLDAGVQRARSEGHDRVWANARVTALGFYETTGWTVTGPVFVTASTGLPHRHVHVELG